jgi:hypothetical protein
MNGHRLIALSCLIVAIGSDGLFASTVHKTKQFAEPRSDKALVYVIREKGFVGGGVGMFIFADDQLLAFLRNGMYSFAYADPGLRLVWGDTPSGLEVQFIAGETYYVGVKAMSPIVLLTEEEGKKAIEKAGAYIEADQADIENGAKKIAKRYEKAQTREAKKEKAEVEEVAALAPASGEGTIQLAANTKIAIELMENLSSSLSKMGETVWFRVAEDVAAEGAVLIPRGSRVKATVRQARPGRSYGEQGSLEVALVSVDLDDKTRIALVGQLAAAGDSRAAGVMSGLLAGAFIKGTEAFYPVGTRFSAWTRDEIGLPPAVVPPAASHSGVAAPPRDFTFGANTRRDPASLDLSFPCSGDVSDVKIVAAGDWTLPEPVAAAIVTRQAETCVARFAGWNVLRHVRASEKAEALHLHALSGGSEVHIEIPARMRVE